MAALGVAVVWGLYEARGAILLVYVSVLLATGFSPLVYAIEHQDVIPVGTKRLPRWLAILVIYIVIVGTLALVGLLVFPPLVQQAEELWRRLPSLLDQAQDVLMRYGLLSDRITLREAVQNAPSPAGNAVGTITAAVTSVFSGVIGFFTILILTFYLLVESDSLMSGFARLFPRAQRPRVREASRKIAAKVSAWLSGQLMLAGVIGATAAIGLYLLGVPYFYVLAVVAALGEMIPVVGPIIAAVPGVLVGFAISPQTGLFVLIFYVAQQQFENHVLVPKVMERQVGVSAVVVIVALLIGASILGIVGAILAVPTAAIIQVVIQQLLEERDLMEEADLIEAGNVPTGQHI